MGIVRRSRRVQSAAAVRASWFPKQIDGPDAKARMMAGVQAELSARLQGWTLTGKDAKTLLAICRNTVAMVTQPKDEQ